MASNPPYGTALRRPRCGARALAGLLDGGLLDQPAASSLPEPGHDYFAYGRLAVGIYGLLAWALWGLRAMLGGKVLWLLGGLGAAALVGDVTAYWVSQSAGPGARQLGFWFTELPALCGVTVVLTATGLWRWRSGRPGGVLGFSAVAAVLATAVLRYLPHTLLLADATVMAVALTLALRRGEQTSDNQPAQPVTPQPT